MMRSGIQTEMEMTMRKTIFTAVVVIAGLTAQAAAASGNHHARTKVRPVASEKFRNSNAYAAPSYPSVSDYNAEQSYFTNMGNGYSAGGY